MERVYSLSLHELRISEGRKGIDIVEGLRKHFQIPLTIHLVFDEDLAAQSKSVDVQMNNLCELLRKKFVGF